MEPDQTRTLQALVHVCGFLPTFLDKGSWSPATPLEDLVFRTVVRGRGTYETIVDLAAADRSLQAAMLGRALFEDMVIAHWLVMHRNDPAWLIDRFERHANAMRLYDEQARRDLGWPPSGDDISQLSDVAGALRSEFGQYAEKPWWGREHGGQSIGLAGVVRRLSDSKEFQPRLRGETPVLQEYYALQQKAWNQALHHTAFGMQLVGGGGGPFPRAVARPNMWIILLGNYWVFGQLIYVALELAGVDALPYYSDLFLAGMAVFGEAVGAPVEWADEVAIWAKQFEAGGAAAAP